MSQVIRSLALLMFIGGWGSASASASASPIQAADILSINDREWAQPDQFLGLSWHDIDAVCPAGVCGTGTLNGFDMVGWTWASVADTNTLLNTYLSARGVSDNDLLGPIAPDVYTGTFYGPLSDPLLSDGWRATFVATTQPYYIVDGWSSNFAAGSTGSAFHPYYSWVGNSIAHTITADTSSVIAPDDDYFFFEDGFEPIPNNPGGWFYRNESEVPTPPTAWLFGLAVLALGIVRRRKRID